MKEYAFPAPCPPQALKAHLTRQAAARIEVGPGEEVELKLKWRGPLSFKLRTVRSGEALSSVPDRGEGLPDGTVMDKHRAAAGAGKGAPFQWRATFGVCITKEWIVSEPFCGTITSDGGAGSVLRGRFPFWSRSALCIAGFGAVALAAALWAGSPLIAVAAVLLSAWYLYHHGRRKDRRADSRWIIETLQQIARTAPSEQETEF